MKKIVTLFMVFATSLALHATGNPSLDYFRFSFNNTIGLEVSDGWSCFGNATNSEPIEIASKLGFEKEGSSYLIIDTGEGERVAWSNSSYTNHETASNFLVSPQIEINSDNAILQFNVYAYTNAVKDHYYNIYVSETGNTAADFSDLTPIYEAKLGGAGSASKPALNDKLISLALNGYKGKKIYLAFQDVSTDALLTGFSNISISEYALDFTNTSAGYAYSTGKFDVEGRLYIMTPQLCSGFKATLRTEDGSVESVYETTKEIGQRYTSTNITFDKPINLTELGQEVKYSITIEPNAEGYQPSVYNYTLACGTGYPSVCVMEEPTGTGCQWCVRGIGFMNYFTDKYPERFIGIAVHSNMFGADPMMTEYLSEMDSYVGKITGLPCCVLNRATTYIDPSATAAVAKVLESNTFVKMNVDNVNYDETSKTVSVTYTPEFDFAVSGNFGVCCVVRENGVHGSGIQWTQANAMSGYRESQTPGGSELYPYFEWIFSQPSTIPANVMKYDHVGWGVYNDFTGSLSQLPTSFEKGKGETYSLVFNMPSKVQDWHNTSIVVMFTNLDTGEILTAKAVEAEQYTANSVESLSKNNAEKYSVIKAGDYLQINAEEGAYVEMYTLTGCRLGSLKLTSASQQVNLPEASGMLIVRISKDNNCRIIKVMN